MSLITLFDYHVARESGLPPCRAALQYILAGNGLFARGAREGLQVCMPLAECRVKGLVEIEPYLKLDYPRVPTALVSLMLCQAWLAADIEARPIEVLFHLHWNAHQWQLEIPPQAQGHAHAQPLGPALGSSYQRAIIEVHSHHALPPCFSDTDNADETGFRIFAVLGHIFTQPQLRVRVGLYGHYWPIPATWVFELPPNVMDGVHDD